MLLHVCAMLKLGRPLISCISRAPAVRADTRGGGLRGRIFVSQIGVEVNPEQSGVQLKKALGLLWACGHRGELGGEAS